MTTPQRKLISMVPKKKKPWSHQDDLAAMRGKRVVVNFVDGQTSTFTLLEADSFAVKVRNEYDVDVIVWKHDLCTIALEPAAGK